MLARFGTHAPLQKDIDQLERVQRFAELLNRFIVPSLGDHRNCLSLCTVIKVVKELDSRSIFPIVCLCIGLPH